jgi:hypothetical protein
MDATDRSPLFSSRLALYYWLLGLAQAAHSSEEVAGGLNHFMGTISDTVRASLPWLPHVEMSATAFAIGNLAIVAALLGTAPIVMQGAAVGRAFALIAGVIEMLNAMIHSSGSLLFGRYVPGVVTAPLLFVIALLLLRQWRAGRPRGPAGSHWQVMEG